MKRYEHCKMTIVLLTGFVLTDSTETTSVGEYEKIILDIWSE